MEKILIVEDESLVAMEIESALTQQGYQVCGIVDNAREAIELTHSHSPDAVLMDIYLNGSVDGIRACRKIKELGDIPVIFLTAYSDNHTVDEAVECQPDGYLVKPFRRSELIATLKLVLKRYQNDLVPICNDLYYDRNNFQIVRGGERIDLTKKEVELLEFCLARKGRVVPFDDLEYALWPDGAIADATRRALIHRLRSKLGGECLKSLPGIGCKLS
ncbi:MAG: response regulator transcription factor [Epsilonproteobacteria bacterium]|nr:hypothetical protein [Campylobacterota bacterium]NPA56934.1 response regulator transcription factor [Campylobacterota bacterium]